jgi:hypothetical protein
MTVGEDSEESATAGGASVESAAAGIELLAESASPRPGIETRVESAGDAPGTGDCFKEEASFRN